VVMTCGCFDILHAGHVDFLKRCKALGTYLIVALNTDASVKMLNKGDDRPIQPYQHRRMILEELRCVDCVVPVVFDWPRGAIEEFRPKIFCKGAEYRGMDIPELLCVKNHGGEVRFLDRTIEVSTTSILTGSK